MTAFICSFTGAIGDMKPRDQRDPMKVLAVLEKSLNHTEDSLEMVTGSQP